MSESPESSQKGWAEGRSLLVVPGRCVREQLQPAPVMMVYLDEQRELTVDEAQGFLDRT